MRRIVAFTLVVALLISSAAKTMLLADYLLNKEYIAKVLCINRDKPEMHCNGKCHLAKQLKAQEEGERGNQKSGVHIDESDSEVQPAETLIIISYSSEVEHPQAELTFSVGCIDSIDHPPCTAA